MLCVRNLLLLLSTAVACVQGAEPTTNQAPVDWVSIPNTQTALGLTNSEHLADGLVFSNATHALHIFAGRRTATIDGTLVWLHLPPQDASTNDLRDVARADYDTLLHPILLATSAPPTRPLIVLDAGHGGDDSGARSAAPEVQEKTLTLDIACDVAAQLRAAGQQVLLTRASDAAKSLGDRTRFAATHHAQLFVSIHANSAPANPLAIGAETYILPAPGFSGTGEFAHGPTNACPGNHFDTANALLGFAIHRRCAPATSMDRGLKRARFFVLKEASCPAVLIECGFLTNTNDTSLLRKAAYRAKFAQALTAGILDYTRLALPPASTPPADSATILTVASSTNSTPPALQAALAKRLSEHSGNDVPLQ